MLTANKVTDQADTVVRSIESDGRHSLTLKSIQAVSGPISIMPAVEHLTPAHPVPHHRILRGTVGESHIPKHMDMASAPGDRVKGGDVKLPKKTLCGGALLQIGIWHTGTLIVRHLS